MGTNLAGGASVLTAMLGVLVSIGPFLLAFTVTVIYLHIFAGRHDAGKCWWFWYGYWPLNATTVLAMANMLKGFQFHFFCG